MQISQMFKRKPCVFSIECFPPKQTANFGKMKDTLRTMRTLNPDFISVTYGAGGSTGGVSTVEVAEFLKNDLNVEPLAHMICMGSDKAKAAQLLDQLNAAGVRNVLTLRGDRTPTRPESPDFAHASDLAQFVWQTQPEFDIHAACYPEGHPDSENSRTDIENLKRKVDAGCKFLTTQMFFDNNILYNFMYRIQKAGIYVPVVAGVMPVINARQIKRICSISANALPQRFLRIVDRYADSPDAMKQAGIAYATEQVIDLFANGVNAVHIYSMNNPSVAAAIKANISEILKQEN